MPGRRLTVSAVVLVLSLLVAGCTSDAGLTPGSTMAQRAAKADAMLENPPGSNVKPTGQTRDFTLYLHRMTNHEVFPGAPMTMWGFSLSDDPATAQVPGPTLRVTEGDLVRVTLVGNVAGFNHTIHWHGQNVPYDMDGVPYMTQDPAQPGEAFTYEFIAKPAGTYWYHCHVDAQHHIDMGMYGAFLVDPQDPADDPRYDQDYVLLLDDMDRFHLEGGQATGGNLPQSGDPELYEEWLRRQATDSINRNPQIEERVTGTPLRPARGPEYGYPVTHAPYTANYNTWLINGYAFPYTEPIIVKEGQTIRLRFINVANDLMTMHLHGHHMLVTHKDGVLLESPYWVDVIALAPGERYDAYVKLDNPGAWDLHDHIGTHTQNDNIFPGGAMMVLAYEQFADKAHGGHQHGGHGGLTSGSFFGWTGHELP